MDAILDRFFEMSRDLLCVAGFDGRLQRVNPAWTRKLGYGPDQLIGSRYIDLFHPDDRDDARRHVESLEHGTALPMLEARLRRHDGEYLCFLWSATAIPERAAMVAVGTDISALKRNETALRDSESMFRTVMECAADAIITADEAGCIHTWNGSAQRLFGYSPEEVVGMPLTMLMPERYRAAHAAGIARFVAGGAPQVIGRTVALHGLRRGGEEFPMELSLSTWTGATGRRFTGIVRETRERPPGG